MINFFFENNYQVVFAIHKKNIADEEIISDLRKKFFNYYSISYKENSLNSNSKLNYIYNFFFTFLYIVKIIYKERPKAVILSTGRYHLLNFLLLPLKVVYIFHTYPMENLNFIDKNLFTNHLNVNKKNINCSNFAKNRIIEFCVNSKSKNDFINVIYPGLEKVEIIKKKKNSYPCVLTLGHVAWSKNPEVWISVAKKVTESLGKDNVNFIWIGEGFLNNEYFERCRDKVSDFSNINFIGFKKDVQDYFLTSSIYFQPSNQESFGLSVIKAMKYSIPCVCSNIGGLTELITDQKNGFLSDPENVNKMSKDIIKLYENKKLREEMGAKASEKFKEKFSLNKWEDDMNIYFEGFLGK